MTSQEFACGSSSYQDRDGSLASAGLLGYLGLSGEAAEFRGDCREGRGRGGGRGWLTGGVAGLALRDCLENLVLPGKYLHRYNVTPMSCPRWSGRLAGVISDGG